MAWDDSGAVAQATMPVSGRIRRIRRVCTQFAASPSVVPARARGPGAGRGQPGARERPTCLSSWPCPLPDRALSSPHTFPDLPLFPLGTVLFPGGMLPLRIFELRYLRMVARCHQRGEPFGVVALRQGSEVRRPGQPAPVPHDCGTLARVTALHAPQPGLLLARCEGGQRFRLGAWRQQPDGLWTGEATLLDPDRATPIPPDLAALAGALRQALDPWTRQEPPASPAPAPELFNDAGWVANRWCELLPLPLAQKQQLMALDNPLVRLELVGDLLTASPALGAS